MIHLQYTKDLEITATLVPVFSEVFSNLSLVSVHECWREIRRDRAPPPPDAIVVDGPMQAQRPP